MRSINPATEKVLAEYPEHGRSQVADLLGKADEAFGGWRATPIDQRSRAMHQAAWVLRKRAPELSALITTEMGKPIAQSEAEIEKCAICCDHFADHASRYLAGEAIESDGDQSYVRYDPLGAVLAIMPWNFPFWQVFRFAAPSLMAGNVGVLKHAPNVPGCALAIESIFRDAGFPPGVFTTLLVDAGEVEEIIKNPVIKAVTLTGSSRAGKAVASEAGRALKKTVLELGGSDPFIVLDDAGIEAAARSAVAARTLNAGQSCIAAKRFIVVGNAEVFAREMAREMAEMKAGDPMDRSVEIGPLARLDLLQNLESQVRRSIEAGATLLTGGRRMGGKGFYYAPTVLGQVRPGMAAFDEETFGPVAAVISARDDDQAVDLANQSVYGLGASIWTHDIDRARKLAARIESGSVFVNGAVKSDPRLPFGGIKQSGYGRELSRAGIHEFVNIKTVWVKKAESESPSNRSE
jgi:succinate-semialdehyde dehydrogenase / glutarate-semialdehyde dehydrogenase